MVFPSGGDVFYTHFKYHLGSAYIIAYLRKHGFKSDQFISNESYNVNNCVKEIMNFNPKVVGFTVYDSNYMQCVLISNGLKSYNSDIIIIFGGPTATVQSKDILEDIASVDLCVRQEGEEVLLELLSALSKTNFALKKVDLYKIEGITFRNEYNIIINNPDCNILFSNRFINNYLDKYPSPYLSKVIPASNAFPTGLITARGCNQNCIYCNCAVLYKKNIFFHSKDRVIEELAYLSEQKKFFAPIPIYDDSFTIIPARTKKICEAIIDSNIKIPLLCITRCDRITEELLDLMKQAGFKSIGFSLESAVPRVLRTIGKVNPPEIKNSENYDKEILFIEKLQNMTSYAKKIGMYPVFASIMIGLPGESLQDAQKTIEFVNQLDIDYYTHNILRIFKGTPIYQNYKKYGYKIRLIGQKNKIFLSNNFPFDVYKIKLATNSTKERNSKVIDYDTLNILSLNIKRTNEKSFFDNVIINSDVLKPSLVKWMQENLAINGVIIQIYSNKIKYLKNYKQNERTLYNEFSPTKFYECYYWENYDHGSILKSGRMVFYGEEIGLPIKFKNTCLALEEYKEGYDDMQYLICKELTVNDTKALYELLVEISKSADRFDFLLKSNPLPQFQHLCRWTKDQANCRYLETAIIGNDDSIRICWNSDPIGKIGISYLDIKRNLQDLELELVERRNCNKCNKNKNCIKCLFPYPCSSKEYCELKNLHDTNEPARLINAFNIIKEFLFKPINPYNF